MRFRGLFWLSITAGLLTFTTSTAAIDKYNRVAASTCEVVNGEKALNKWYVTLWPGATGTLRLNCPIDRHELDGVTAGGPYFLYLTYRDSSGRRESASVTAQLIRVDMLTGAHTITPMFTSEEFAITTTTFQHGAQAFGGLDDGAYYYLQVNLTRKFANQIVEFHGALIGNLPPG